MALNPTPPMPAVSDLVFTLGMKAGAALGVELVRTYGVDSAAGAVDWNVASALSGSERAILADAVHQIVSARIAP